MRFEGRIFVTYAILVVILVTSLGVGFRIFMIRENERDTFQSIRVMAEKSSKQLDEVIRPMKFITDFLLSDMNILSGFSILETIDGSTRQGGFYREEARSVIRKAFYTYGILENFYRVSYFNEKKDFITSNFHFRILTKESMDLDRIPWLFAARKLRGKPVTSGAHRDPWVEDNEAIEVFSLGRAMPGAGYIEVQQDTKVFDNIFILDSNNTIKAIAFNAYGDILYSDFDHDPNLYYAQVAQNFREREGKGTVDILKNPKTGGEDIIASYVSNDSGLQILLVQDKNTIIESLAFMTTATILVALFIIFVSLLYIYIVAKRLTKPIKTLTKQIEGTALDNIQQDVVIDTSNDEIEALSNSFVQLLLRLNESIIKEKKMSLLHLQTQLDSLQAQINPHFLYNVLNVISYRGMENGDDEICNICDSLASMLRYSTNTKAHNTIMKYEVKHLENYVYLLSTRYGDKLSFFIDVDSELAYQAVPKLVLQPLVENSINHGFDRISGVMCISVTGFIDDGWWTIRVRDNGQGFSARKMEEIKQQMQNIEREIMNQQNPLELDIGGMGLINTYARLFLLYGKECIFSFRNHDNGGAEVTIGARYSGIERPELMNIDKEQDHA